MDSTVQIIVTIIGVLGSASIWKYMEARLKAKSESDKLNLENNDGAHDRDWETMI